MKTKFIIVLAVLLVVSILCFNSSFKNNKVMQVKIGTVQYGELISSVSAIGVVKAEKEIRISSKAEGIIESVLANEGKHVVAGRDLVKLLSESGDIFVKSPFSGKVISLPKETAPGLSVSPGQHLLTVANTRKLIVEVSINEIDIGKIRLNQKSKIRSDSLLGKEFEGTVSHIAPAVEEVDGVAKVLVRIAVKSDSGFMYGSQVIVDIIVALREDALSVPLESLFEDNGQKYIFLYKDSVAKKCTVSTGIADVNRIEVISKKLKSGDKIILGDITHIRDGMKVGVAE